LKKIFKIFKTITSIFIPKTAVKPDPSSPKKFWKINIFGSEKQPNMKQVATKETHSSWISRENSFSIVNPLKGLNIFGSEDSCGRYYDNREADTY
jgi:hypothetical protein